ncbi:MAG: PBP1A family penicillin-binding protein [Parvularculaceae bacterium]|nr:PBP1A family penicillin-binding protein [Parvularculaceae bacterium]
MHLSQGLPSTDGLWRSEAGPRYSLVAADGAPITIHGQSYGAPVRLADLPDYVPGAILAVEDRNFYHHIGVNPLSLLRAFIVNTREGAIRQGGSTLTQQLAKNLFLSPDRTYRRKIRELLLALWLEQRFSKSEILTIYLNRVYFGAGAYGIDAASFRYFGKPAQRLTLSEAAILAGLLKAPSHYAPDRNPDDAGARARLVIDAMLDAGFISRTQAQQAYKTPVFLGPSQFSGAPYFVDYALSEAHRAAPVDANLTIRTTLDPVLQDALEVGVAAGTALADLDPGIQLAAVILDQEGAVKAMVGGRDYRQSQFNRAVQARRQPGSAFKPFVYLAAIEQGASPDAHIDDSPIKIGAYEPENYNGQYYGDVTFREALARSLNAATIRVQEQVGRPAVRLTARRMGLSSSLSQGAALALGVDEVSPLELAGAYAPFANGGYRVRVHVIEQIETNGGDEIFRRPPNIVDVAAPSTAILALNSMLAAIPEWGTGRAASLSVARAMGKTGTTQGGRDGWFAGHAGGLVCVVWIGRDDNGPMETVTGGGAPAIVWREIMERALISHPPKFRQSSPPLAPQDPLVSVLEAVAG